MDLTIENYKNYYHKYKNFVKKTIISLQFYIYLKMDTNGKW